VGARRPAHHGADHIVENTDDHGGGRKLTARSPDTSPEAGNLQKADRAPWRAV
jgi:hypothetical protein